MTASKAEEKIEALCALFNVEASAGFHRDRKEWYVSLRGKGLCRETGSTMRHKDGSVEKLLGGSASLYGSGRTLLEAVEKIESYTVANGGGFMMSNQELGMFSMNEDDGEHIIELYEGTKKIESFAYDKERIRAAIHKYQPK
jgi:hypothetical protein